MSTLTLFLIELGVVCIGILITVVVQQPTREADDR